MRIEFVYYRKKLQLSKCYSVNDFFSFCLYIYLFLIFFSLFLQVVHLTPLNMRAIFMRYVSSDIHYLQAYFPCCQTVMWLQFTNKDSWQFKSQQYVHYVLSLCVLGHKIRSFRFVFIGKTLYLSQKCLLLIGVENGQQERGAWQQTISIPISGIAIIKVAFCSRNQSE